MRSCEFRDMGRIGYGEACALQLELVEQRKQDRIPDQLLLVEHPHVVTLGRNAREENLLASAEIFERSGVEVWPTDRGGDVTYHGPGQIVGYPILDLKQWKRDVAAYVRALEEVIINTLAAFGIEAGRLAGCTGVWSKGAKVAAIGVHLSRWVTSHGFALNVETDLRYFQYIVPCGLSKPVASMRSLGYRGSVADVRRALTGQFGEVFGYEMSELETSERSA